MDRISGLPDELLIKILLFLPTKVAVSTSLLSKRWEFLWMWLPKLEYDVRSSSFFESLRLLSFLDRNLAYHRTPVIERLCLQLSCSHFKPEDVRMCVLMTVSRIIRELEISYSSDLSNLDVLPSSLYACKSLVVLKLSGSELSAILVDVPRLGCLASLKTLQLQNLRYLNDDSFRRLLSICPVLEHLSVDRCKDDNMGNFTIIMNSLLSLSIFIPNDCHLDGYVINTPSLKHLKLKDHNYTQSHYCLIENMPKLSKAYVDVSLPDIKGLIGSITSVKHLSICSKAIYGDGFVFNQLEHLKLCVCKEYSSNLLVRMLKDAPNLRVLDLFIMDYWHDDYINFWNPPSTVPECLLSILQTFIWSGGYMGTPEERDLVVYILKNARHLKTTTISFLEGEVPKVQMIQELAHSSRASTMCELTFH